MTKKNKNGSNDCRDDQNDISDECCETRTELRNEDAITGEPGSHPVGTGIGTAIGAAAAGAAAGTLAGPVGTVVGAVVGGVVGGLAGKAAAESIDPTVEAAYWEANYSTRPYYRTGQPYDYYRSAYEAGWESYDGPESTWAEREPHARKKWEGESRWENEGGAPTMTWEEAKQAAKDAHDRAARRYSEGINDGNSSAPTNMSRKNPR